ncbi:MAG: transglycosylase SLT domain-containing protein [bacterium]
MAKIVFATLLLCLAIANPQVFADNHSDAVLKKQRETYDQALKELRAGQTLRFKRLRDELSDYPLIAYLDYAYLATRLSLSRKSEVDRFFKDHEGQPVSARLRYRWLEYLRKNNRHREFLAYYQPGNGSTEQSCFYQYARFKTDDKTASIEESLDLWNVGKSQPKECDALFDILIKNNHVDETVAWKRYTQAVLNHQYRLANYIKRFFKSPRYQALADTYMRVDQSPELIGKFPIFQEDSPEITQVLTHGLTHLARRHAKKALGYWNLYHQAFQFSASEEKRILSALVKGMYAQESHAIADQFFRDNLDRVDTSLVEWRLREALSEVNWHDLATWIAVLPDELREHERWQYWSIRADRELNHINDRDASKRYTALAARRNFYGFLAADATDQPYAMEHQPVEVDSTDIENLHNLPAFVRMVELRFHGDDLNARREWIAATTHFTEPEWIVAAAWATREQWPDRAIGAMIKASYWNDVDIRFPMPYPDHFSAQSAKTGVPLNLLYALARQESSLNTDAVSPAGARGLIQLMPSTAKRTAAKYGIAYRGTNDLHTPDVNIKLGSRYFADQLQRFDSVVLAAAAYNAGPNRVSQWLTKSQGARPFDVWIETIPFTETRQYVQNVLAFAVIYAHHLREKNPALLKNGDKRNY